MKVHAIAHHMRSIFDTSFLWSRLMRRRLRPSLLGWISFSTKCCTKGTLYQGGVQRKRVLLSDDVFQIRNILKPNTRRSRDQNQTWNLHNFDGKSHLENWMPFINAKSYWMLGTWQKLWLLCSTRNKHCSNFIHGSVQKAGWFWGAGSVYTVLYCNTHFTEESGCWNIH